MAVDRLGIMQPYFFPYIGYFDLIDYVDEWVVFDPVQYIRKGWINRNRVLKKGGEWKYLGVSVEKASRETLIRDIKVSNAEDWKEKVIRNLDYYQLCRAPRYQEVLSLLERCFEAEDFRISAFNAHLLEQVCKELHIDFKWRLYSEMQLDHKPASHAGEWALRVAEAMKAKEYVNPPGGHAIFDAEQFKQCGIKLKYLHPELKAYDQGLKEFIPGLSIIDMLMFKSPEEIRQNYMQYDVEDGW